MRHLAQITDDSVSFWLPGHKADQFYEGNRLFVLASSNKPYSLFLSYLHSHDMHFRSWPELWLRANGTIPTHHWFITRLRNFFLKFIAGQSMCAGGATALAEAGTAPLLIQAAGRWSTDTFNCYVCKSPFLLIALLTGQAPHAAAEFL